MCSSVKKFGSLLMIQTNLRSFLEKRYNRCRHLFNQCRYGLSKFWNLNNCMQVVSFPFLDKDFPSAFLVVVVSQFRVCVWFETSAPHNQQNPQIENSLVKKAAIQ